MHSKVFDSGCEKKHPGGQSGFTMLETVCSLAIIGLLSMILSISIIQVKAGTPKTDARTTAVQNNVSAGRIFYQDVMMAQGSDLPDNRDTASSVTLTWVDTFQDQYITHAAYYYLFNGELRRNYDGEIRVAARHVSTVAFWYEGVTIYMLLTCQVDDRYPEQIVTQTYQARMRAVL